MSGTKPGINVVFISRVKRNPYVDLLRAGLEQAVPGLRARVVDIFSLGWMWRHRHIDVLHIHWLELLILYPSWTRSVKRFLSVMLGLALARLSGVCLVYTVHNLAQHEGRRRHLVHWATRITLWLASGVHVHDRKTADALEAQWGRTRGVHIIPHGNYVGAYPNVVSRAEARRALDLPEEAFIYLSLGRVRPYKGVEALISAFRGIDDPAAFLLVAGEAQEPGYQDDIALLAQGDGRIRLHLDFVADEQLQFYLNACDMCVLPYEHVTTSGAALLAYSFGVPIIAPAIGCFRELVGAAERGMLYGAPPEEGSIFCPDLGAALRQVRSADLDAMRSACWRYIHELDWRRVAEQHAAVYQRCMES